MGSITLPNLLRRNVRRYPVRYPLISLLQNRYSCSRLDIQKVRRYLVYWELRGNKFGGSIIVLRVYFWTILRVYFYPILREYFYTFIPGIFLNYSPDILLYCTPGILLNYTPRMLLYYALGKLLFYSPGILLYYTPGILLYSGYKVVSIIILYPCSFFALTSLSLLGTLFA